MRKYTYEGRKIDLNDQKMSISTIRGKADLDYNRKVVASAQANLLLSDSFV